MTLYIGFPNLFTAVTTDDNIYSDRTRNNQVYGIQNLCTTCASIPCKDNFFISFTQDKTKRTKKRTQYEPNSKENPV